MDSLTPPRPHWVIAPEVAAASFVGGYRGATQARYGAILRKWLWFCYDTGLDPWAVHRAHIEGWLGTMKPTVAKEAATVVCGFYRDAHTNGLTPHDLGVGVRRPRVGRRMVPSFATVEELGRMYQWAKTEGGDTWALIAILALMGTRIGETLALNIADVERDPIRLVVRRKFDHTDVLTCPTGVVYALTPLLDARSAGPLLRHQGRRMTPMHARRVVSTAAEAAECTHRLTPHSLRRSFVTAALDAGATRTEIMAMTGHSDPSMIEYYDRGRKQRAAIAGQLVSDLINKHEKEK